MSQEQLEKESGVPHTTISDLESGRRKPESKTIKALKQIADTLGISLLEAYDRAGLLDFTDEADRDAIEAALLIVRLNLSPQERAELLQMLRDKE